MFTVNGSGNVLCEIFPRYPKFRSDLEFPIVVGLKSCGDLDDPNEYRGTLNRTQKGEKCQRWDSQTPHTHSITPQEYSHRGIGAHNYCRNPTRSICKILSIRDNVIQL